jgi:xylulokinase
MLASDCLIGIDIGTSAIKAVLLTTSGERLASFATPIATSRSAPGLAEQSPTDWMDGVLAALSELSTHNDMCGLAGIGICSQANTHVFVGATGTALIPAITWQDIRCAADAAVLDARVSASQKTAWFGAPIPIDASHALSRMAYIARAAPAIYAQTRNVLLPKDYCVMQLTGAVFSDALASVGLVGRDGQYARELLELVPRSHEFLPELRPSEHVAGRMRPGLPCAGTPVVVGTMDAWAGMFGVGVMRDGDAMYQAGTSEILGIISSRLTPTAGAIVFPPYDGIVLHAAPTQTGGAALEWFSDLLEITPGEASTLAATARPSDAVPLFLPHLEGERAPVWDTNSRGVFARIDSRARTPEMVLSVMEGVAFSARWAFEELQESSQVLVSSANIGGGGALSDLWCQIRADALGRVLQRVAITDAAALGAAILAGVGCGLMSSATEAVRQLVHFDRSFEPQAQMRGYYDDKYGNYRALYNTLRPFNRRYLPD